MKRGFIALILSSILILVPEAAEAGFFEISLGGAYNRSDYDRGSFSWTKRYGGSVGYNFSDASTLEFSYQKSWEKSHYEGYQDSINRDEVFSANWVQNLTSKQAMFQPYLKGGVGQLIREAEVRLFSGQQQNSEVKSVTGVAGLGMRIYLTKTFALRFEGTSYLVGGKPSTWNENFAISAGASIFF